MRTVVYFIAVGSPPEACKIGHTCDVLSRLNSIQTGNHLPVRLLGVVPGDHRLERALHQRFARLRLQGEWFRWDDEIASVVPEADAPFSGFVADDDFVGVRGVGYPRSFYRAFVRDRSSQWWRFQSIVEPVGYDPVERQRSLASPVAPTFYGRLADAASFEGKTDNPALLRVLTRARELAA